MTALWAPLVDGAAARQHALASEELDELMDAAAGFFELLTRPPWMADAACIEHPEVDFVNGTAVDEAVGICAGCLVREECLAYGTEGREVGVWGALTPAQRGHARKPPVYST